MGELDNLLTNIRVEATRLLNGIDAAEVAIGKL
jgi:hypothetical protein